MYDVIRSSQQPCRVDAVIMPVLQTRIPRLREGKPVNHGITASKGAELGSNPKGLTAEPMCSRAKIPEGETQLRNDSATLVSALSTACVPGAAKWFSNQIFTSPLHDRGPCPHFTNE